MKTIYVIIAAAGLGAGIYIHYKQPGKQAPYTGPDWQALAKQEKHDAAIKEQHKNEPEPENRDFASSWEIEHGYLS